jgi:hypothetical protein
MTVATSSWPSVSDRGGSTVGGRTVNGSHEVNGQMAACFFWPLFLWTVMYFLLLWR